MKQKLSAFIDAETDELEERRVLNALTEDEELRATWERYHLARAAIQEELDDVLAPGLADRVMQQLQHAPAVAPPGRLRRIAPETVFKALGAAAIAASVAVIAIVGLQTLNEPTGHSAAHVAINDLSQGEYIRAGATRWDTRQPEVESALNVYLVEHNEFASTGMNGMLPYVRVVVYDSTQ